MFSRYIYIYIYIINYIITIVFACFSMPGKLDMQEYAICSMPGSGTHRRLHSAAARVAGTDAT